MYLWVDYGAYIKELAVIRLIKPYNIMSNNLILFGAGASYGSEKKQEKSRHWETLFI